MTKYRSTKFKVTIFIYAKNIDLITVYTVKNQGKKQTNKSVFSRICVYTSLDLEMSLCTHCVCRTSRGTKSFTLTAVSDTRRRAFKQATFITKLMSHR